MAKTNKPHDVFKQIDMTKSKEECWEWKGKFNAKDGRPYFTVDGNRKPAYVFVLETFTGKKSEGRFVLHSCDNPKCCSPHHLNWGTHQDNMNEMKDRERHGLPKIVVRAIRRLLVDGKTHQEIAELYGVSREAVTAINNNRR